MKGSVFVLASAVLAATLLACGAAWAASVAFSAPRDYAVGDTPYGATKGDLDGDKDADVAVASQGADAVSVLLKRNDGTFRPSRQVPAGDGPVEVRVGDLDGDGVSDLATADLLGHTVSVMLGTGGGSFGPPSSVAAGDRPSDVAGGDFDGDPDLVATNVRDHTLSVLLNDGDGDFEVAGTLYANQFPIAVDVADLDGDGDLDLAVGNGADTVGVGRVTVLLGDGDGTFATAEEQGLTPDASDIAAGDLDGDGDPDLVTANDLDHYVSVRMNNGDGTFADPSPDRQYPLDGTEGPDALTLFDLDRDGDLDVATANEGSFNGGPDNVSVLKNAGDGTLGKPRNFGAGGEPRGIVALRVDGDRKPDLVVANRASDAVSVLRNRTR